MHIHTSLYSHKTVLVIQILANYFVDNNLDKQMISYIFIVKVLRIDRVTYPTVPNAIFFVAVLIQQYLISHYSRSEKTRMKV